MFYIIATVLVLVGLLFVYISYSVRFIAVKAILVSNPEMKIKYILRESRQLIRGHENEILRLLFSFTGWIVLCIFIFPVILVLPYMYMTVMIALDKLINNKISDNAETEESTLANV